MGGQQGIPNRGGRCHGTRLQATHPCSFIHCSLSHPSSPSAPPGQALGVPWWLTHGAFPREAHCWWFRCPLQSPSGSVTATVTVSGGGLSR